MPYILTVDDPFRFSFDYYAGAATVGRIYQNDSPQELTIMRVGWEGGGPDDVNLSAVANPGITVDFSPAAAGGGICANVSQTTNNPCDVSISFSADSSVVSDTYPITIIAQSGTTVKVKSFSLLVGDLFMFDLKTDPLSLRVLDGQSSSTDMVVTALSTSTARTVSFAVGDKPDYRLPDGITANAPASCAPQNNIGAICESG